MHVGIKREIKGVNGLKGQEAQLLQVVKVAKLAKLAKASEPSRRIKAGVVAFREKRRVERR